MSLFTGIEIVRGKDIKPMSLRGQTKGQQDDRTSVQKQIRSGKVLLAVIATITAGTYKQESSSNAKLRHNDHTVINVTRGGAKWKW